MVGVEVVAGVDLEFGRGEGGRGGGGAGFVGEYGVLGGGWRRGFAL